MQALHLIAVFAASGLLALWLSHRFLLPISRRAAAALLLLPLVLTGSALFTGGYYGPLNIAYASAPLNPRSEDLPKESYDNGILSDVAIQMVPWRKAVRKAVFHGQAPLLNRFSLSGDILLAGYQTAVFHPATWIGFLLPLPTAWTFAMAFTQFLAALFAFLFLRELRVGETAAFLGAAAWTLSNLIPFIQGWSLANVFVAFPLLLFGLHRLAAGRGGGFAGALIAYVLMWVGGHPETVLQCSAAAGVFFLFELFASRRRVRAAGGAIAAGLLAFAISAAAVLPFLEALPQTAESSFRKAVFAHEKKSVSAAESLTGVVGLIYPRAYVGVTGRRPAFAGAFFYVNRAYVGGLALALAAWGLASRRREKWGLLAAGLFSLMVGVGFPGISDTVARLPLFDISLNGYFAWIAAFVLSALAGLGAQELQERDAGRSLLPPLFLLASLLLAGLWWRLQLVRNGLDPEPHEISMLAVLVPGSLLILGVMFWRGKRSLLAAWALLLLLLSRTAEIPEEYPTFPSRLFYPEIEEFRSLPAGPEPYRTTGLSYAMVPNQSSLWELEDPRGYQAMTNARYSETFPLWCVPQPVWFNRIDDPTRPFLSFLNVRFAIGWPREPVPPGWREFARGGNCSVFQNPRALPRAFAPERIRFVPDGQSTVEEMKTCPDFSKLAWIEHSRDGPGETANGPATVATKREGFDLSLDVRAAAPSWIVVSQTAWKGWKAFLGEERIPLHFANHAFLGFQVPAGSHRVRLLYRPDSFRIGLSVSALSLAATVGVVFLRRKRRLRPEERICIFL